MRTVDLPLQAEKPLTDIAVGLSSTKLTEAVAIRIGKFVELGTFRTKSLRRLTHVEIFKWNSISDQIRAERDAEKPKRNRMRLALHCQSLLDSREVRTRSELVGHLRVSRARVTHALKRLRDH